MASKKSEKSAPAPVADEAAALKKAISETKSRLPDVTAKRAIELIASATLRKLSKQEMGELRSLRLKKDGSAITPNTGPREKSPVNQQAIANVLEIAGVEGLHKMFLKYADQLRKPLAQHVKGMDEGEDRSALEGLSRQMFPSSRKGFAKSDTQKVSKLGRVAVAVGDIHATQGDLVRHEVMTLADGRVGIFVFKDALAPLPSHANESPAWAQA